MASHHPVLAAFHYLLPLYLYLSPSPTLSLLALSFVSMMTLLLHPLEQGSHLVAVAPIILYIFFSLGPDFAFPSSFQSFIKCKKPYETEKGQNPEALC